ncbi:tyrosine-type recombinase/integrase [Bacteroidota bacterium]
MMEISATIYHDTRRQKNDGSYPVKIRTTYKRKQRYYKTDYSMSEEDFQILTSKEILQGKVNKDLKPIREARKKLDSKLAAFTEAAEQLGNAFTWEMFDSQLQKEGKASVKSGKVYEYYDSYIAELETYGKEGTAEVYRNSRDKYKQYRDSLNFDEVTPEFLNSWQRWMVRNGMSKTTISIYVRALRSLYNQAIRKGDANPLQYPFRDYKPPAKKNRKTALSIEDIKKIFEYKEPRKIEEWKSVALAVFKFSYLCGGMNITDIAYLKHTDIKDEFINYDRKKTEDTETESEPIEVFLADEAKNIIKRHGTGSYFIFPFIELNMSPKDRKLRIKQVTKNINKWLKRIAEEVGIEANVSTYTARHSFATVLMKKGITVAQISRMLGHSSISTTQDYLASFSQAETKNASEKLLDF